jgi:hypothetical protein
VIWVLPWLVQDGVGLHHVVHNIALADFLKEGGTWACNAV